MFKRQLIRLWIRLKRYWQPPVTRDKYYKQAKEDAKQQNERAVVAMREAVKEQTQIKLHGLEEQRDALKESIQKMQDNQKAGGRIADVHAMRGGAAMAGIVTNVEGARDANTPILEEAVKNLQSIKDDIHDLNKPGNANDDDTPASF